ncbi:MAG: glycosyltransferase [Mucilaginibacter sp.]
MDRNFLRQMMDKPLVSIIIPLYNAEKYVAEAIRSAQNQTWPNKEIIVVDDGSTDNSLAVANSCKDENTRIITQPNKGASAARNTGLKEAKGEYIQFLDADDLLSENKIAAQVEMLLNFPNYVGLCATVHFQDGEELVSGTLTHEWYGEGTNEPADFLIKLYGGALIGPRYGGMIQPNAWLTPAKLIGKAGLWNEALSLDDDGEFFCRILLASKGIKYVAEGANYYRKFNNQNSLSALKSYEACNSVMQSTLLKAQYLTPKTSDPRAKIALSRLFWENAVEFYPAFPELSMQAEKIARELDPAHNPNRGRGYRFGFIGWLLGWKRMKMLSQWRKKWS